MKSFVLCLVFMLANVQALLAHEEVETMEADTASAAQPTERKLSLLRRVIRGFDRLDTRYIEPQHYVFTVMLQATQNYDRYTLSGSGDNALSVTFAPDINMKIGPYVGWKWFFLGYTFDLHHIDLSTLKQEIDLSIYSSQIGIDLFYRRTGSDYKLRQISFPNGRDDSDFEDMPFDGIRAGITGVNLYYIFNHGRFSYPAAFAQSTCQKISCGSWLTGVGYTQNTLDFDYDRLQELFASRMAPQEIPKDSSLMFRSLKYHDINVSAGYAYNWVFARNWLFAASLQAALAYKKSSGSMSDASQRGFSIENINVNGIGRFGLVYNNMTWYAGLSAIVRSNNYHKSQFSTNNTFGSVNLYVGYNFGLKKKYRQKE